MKTSVINQAMNFTTPGGLYEFSNPQGFEAANIPFNEIQWTKPAVCQPNTIALPLPGDMQYLSDGGTSTVMNGLNTDQTMWLWAVNEYNLLNAGLQFDDGIGSPFTWLNPWGVNREMYANRLRGMFGGSIAIGNAPTGYPLTFIDELNDKWQNLRTKAKFLFIGYETGPNPTPLEIIQNLANPYWVLQNIAPYNPLTGKHNANWLQALKENLAGPGLNNPADTTRLSLFVISVLNNLSAAYGMGETFTVYPEAPKRPGFFQRLWSGVKRFFPVMIVGRNACLALIELNMFNSAAKMHQKQNEKLFLTWERLGGNKSSLQSSINTGKNKPALIGEPATSVALIAAGGAVLTALIECLKDGETDIDELLTNLAPALNVAASTYCQQYQEQFQALINSVQADASEGEYTAMLAPFITMPGFATCTSLINNIKQVLPADVANKIFPPATTTPEGITVVPPVPRAPISPGGLLQSENNSTALVVIGGIAILAAVKG